MMKKQFCYTPEEKGYQSSSNNTPEVQLSKEQRKEIITKTEKEIESGKLRYLESRATKIVRVVCKTYSNLSSFLEESGVVHKIESSGVYIWDYYHKKFGKLVGYEFKKGDVCLNSWVLMII